MSATLYRKYRPQKFSDVIGQQPIIKTLSNAVKYNRIGQAYLFAGPRGTGKTTLARILAMAVNCANFSGEEQAVDKLSIRRSKAKVDKLPNKERSAEPCLKCKICQQILQGKCMDIIEVDAASNTGVDNIRELRETVKLPPVQAKYKVYIIDEIHMLSMGAFNALLKTLEEPPKHVIFILATTEIHKLPETVISRCQRFDFSRLSMENIIKKLASIAKSEKVKIEKAALEIIAMAAEGGMRDAESLLSQIISLEDKNITLKEVEEILGIANRQSVEKMAEYLMKKDVSSALSLINQLTKEGHDPEIFSKSLLNYFRQLMLVSVNPKLVKSLSFENSPEKIKKMELLAKEFSISEILEIINFIGEAKEKTKDSFIPQLPLEIAIVNIGFKKEFKPVTPEKKFPENKPSDKQASIPSQKIFHSKSIKKERPNKKSGLNHTKKSEQTKRSSDSKQKAIALDKVKNKWKDILVKVEPLNHSLSSILAGCQPIKAENNIIVIATQYAFYKDRINEAKNKMAIEKVMGDIFNSKVVMEIITEEEAGIKIERKDKKEEGKNGIQGDLLLSEAMKMMGGKLVK